MLLRICLCLFVAAANGETWSDRDFAAQDLMKFATAEAVHSSNIGHQGSVSQSGESKRYQQVVAPPPGFAPRSARRLDLDTQGYGWQEEQSQPRQRQQEERQPRQRQQEERQPRQRQSDGAEYDSQGNRVRHQKSPSFGYNNRRQQQQYRRPPQSNVYNQGRLQAQRQQKQQQLAQLQARYPEISQQRSRRQPEPEAEPAFRPQKVNKPRILRPVDQSLDQYQAPRAPQSQAAPAYTPQKESQRTLRPVENKDRSIRKQPQNSERTFKKTKPEESERTQKPAASDFSERRQSLEGETFQPRYEPYAAPKNAYEPSYGGPPEQKNLEAAVAAGAAAYNGETYSEPQRLQFQIHGQGGPNSYRFGYDTGLGYNRQFRYEERDDHGVLHGRYGYYTDGKLQIVNYSADPVGGFHAEGDNIPKPQY